MAVRVKEAISFDDPPGVPVTLTRGRLFPEDHPYVKARPHAFEPADDEAARSSGTRAAVETATAGPGERRSVTRPVGRPRKDRDSSEAVGA